MDIFEVLRASHQRHMERWPDDEGARMLKQLDADIARRKRRAPYQIIKDRGGLAFWVIDTGRYTVAQFGDGWGLYMTDGGGCWGYLDDDLVDDMKSAGEFDDRDGLTAKGLDVLRKLQARKVLGIKETQ